MELFRRNSISEGQLLMIIKTVSSTADGNEKKHSPLDE